MVALAKVGGSKVKKTRRLMVLVVGMAVAALTAALVGTVRPVHGAIFDEPVGGAWGSDHFGVVADLSALTSSGRPVQ